ncbi:hypothetical protein PG994_014114 [Apiospora phragmitis]|uniref:Uncharacterized protein n=1 Tax=Apiospora phragmitis TaxID=2905665 RepID=A0ABR1T3U3_9PEZI
MFEIGAQGCVTRAYLWGLGKHDLEITVIPQLVNIQKWDYIGIIPSMLAPILAGVRRNVVVGRLEFHADLACLRGASTGFDCVHKTTASTMTRAV